MYGLMVRFAANSWIWVIDLTKDVGNGEYAPKMFTRRSDLKLWAELTGFKEYIIKRIPDEYIGLFD